jgi:hypothetical protein
MRDLVTGHHVRFGAASKRAIDEGGGSFSSLFCNLKRSAGGDCSICFESTHPPILFEPCGHCKDTR